MRKFAVYWLCLILPGFVYAKDYYDDFAKEYEKKLHDLAWVNNKSLTQQEVIETWNAAWGHFQPGYVPILDKNGRLLDWVAPGVATRFPSH